MPTKEHFTKFIFETTNILKVQDFLDENTTLDPREYQDKKLGNVLHAMSFNEHIDIIKIYVNHTTNLIQKQITSEKESFQKKDKQILMEWINQKNQEGFTPLLYAAFNGDIELIHYLIDLGANKDLSNNTRLNVLHMAAQGDRVSTLIYFRNKLDYNQCDSKGSTPLHWAAYNGHEDVAAYLLSLDEVNVNAQDNEGQTPLLLATLYGNTRIVRRLLMKGAKRSIRNTSGQTPIDIAKENSFANITKMLDMNYSCFDFLKFYYNVKLEYRPKERNLKIPITFIVTNFVALIIFHGLLVFKENYVFMYALEAFIIGFMLLLYLTLLKPPKTEEKENISLYIKETKKICFECSRKKPRRSYHCDICKVCVEQYDHHCTWINNCVGKKNIGRFITFVLFIVLSLVFIGVTACWGLWAILKTAEKAPLNDVIEFREDFNNEGYWKFAKAVLFCINIIISLFAIPVLLLLFVQIKNLLINKTTFERMRGDNSEVRDQLKQKKKRGPSIANCMKMCSRTRESFSSDNSIEEQFLNH